MTPDSNLLLLESSTAHRAPSLHCTTPPRSAVINVQDEAPLHQKTAHWSLKPVYASKNDAPKEETTPTHHRVRGLSGSSACRWYIHEDIPDINSFSARSNCSTVLQLAQLGPFDEMNKWFHCTAIVDRIMPDKRWWFASCGACRKSARFLGDRCQCSDISCTSGGADLTYCVGVIATDGTTEAEFVLFDKISMIEETYNPELPSSVFGLASASDKSSSSSQVLELGAPYVGNAVSTVMSPPCGLSLHDGHTLPASGQSPTIQPHTLTFHGTGLPFTSSGRLCPYYTFYSFMDEAELYWC
ncbi:hypothetical protein TRIUR3_10300 [Triticum urartu]|uniref:Replication factor A C-terminal domain-containing protein n=1 Tax=Triticum urartu TaxID=4572 RepID=M7YJU9_TRIUA|nr:hypothetical protein TRIUR3_10300 [Triticum urartu]